jgi:hypothetical protein
MFRDLVSSWENWPSTDHARKDKKWSLWTDRRTRSVCEGFWGPRECGGVHSLIKPVTEEQSRTRGGQSDGVEDQPQFRGLWHSGSPSARSLSRSPSPPPPSFTKSPSPPRSLVRDGQISQHRPRLVASRSTCPPLFPSLHANCFKVGTDVINTQTHFVSSHDIKVHAPATSHWCDSGPPNANNAMRCVCVGEEGDGEVMQL